ncbi:MAG TPA: helix-turn-helix domain-containing protein [Pyrinomonadaceae bacterium]|nr:helix-turn-helix domain-containing protein [Pyrinomonadaceae bacterium]
MLGLTATNADESVWKDFSLKEEVRRIEERYIEMALKESKGRVSHAAKLLGLKHHESLSSLIATKHPHLIQARTPRTPRKRSIIAKPDSKLAP